MPELRKRPSRAESTTGDPARKKPAQRGASQQPAQSTDYPNVALIPRPPHGFKPDRIARNDHHFEFVLDQDLVTWQPVKLEGDNEIADCNDNTFAPDLDNTREITFEVIKGSLITPLTGVVWLERDGHPSPEGLCGEFGKAALVGLKRIGAGGQLVPLYTTDLPCHPTNNGAPCHFLGKNWAVELLPPSGDVNAAPGVYLLSWAMKTEGSTKLNFEFSVRVGGGDITSDLAPFMDWFMPGIRYSVRSFNPMPYTLRSFLKCYSRLYGRVLGEGLTFTDVAPPREELTEIRQRIGPIVKQATHIKQEPVEQIHGKPNGSWADPAAPGPSSNNPPSAGPSNTAPPSTVAPSTGPSSSGPSTRAGPRRSTRQMGPSATVHATATFSAAASHLKPPDRTITGSPATPRFSAAGAVQGRDQGGGWAKGAKGGSAAAWKRRGTGSDGVVKGPPVVAYDGDAGVWRVTWTVQMPGGAGSLGAAPGEQCLQKLEAAMSEAVLSLE